VRSNALSWLLFNLAAWRLRNTPQYLLVRYEQLVAQSEQELRRICAFVGESILPLCWCLIGIPRPTCLGSGARKSR